MRKWFLFCLMFGLVLVSGCSKKSETGNVDPAQFTTAVKLEAAGCGNFYKVSDGLYRGAQPTAEGFAKLKKLGIKTVVNLRNLHSDRDELKGIDLGYEHIRMEAWDPEQNQVDEFLKIVTDKTKHPAFVHCLHGSDRTGTMVAVYRIVVQGWTQERAIEEMTKGPFGYHEIFKGLPKFLSELDIEKLRKEYNINPE